MEALTRYNLHRTRTGACLINEHKLRNISKLEMSTFKQNNSKRKETDNSNNPYEVCISLYRHLHNTAKVASQHRHTKH